jgi:hypothetical protein
MATPPTVRVETVLTVVVVMPTSLVYAVCIRSSGMLLPLTASGENRRCILVCAAGRDFAFLLVLPEEVRSHGFLIVMVCPFGGPRSKLVHRRSEGPQILARLKGEPPGLIRQPAGPPPWRIPEASAIPELCEVGSRCTTSTTSRSCSSRRTTRTISRQGTRRANGR